MAFSFTYRFLRKAIGYMADEKLKKGDSLLSGQIYGRG